MNEISKASSYIYAMKELTLFITLLYTQKFNVENFINIYDSGFVYSSDQRVSVRERKMRKGPALSA